VVESAVLVGLGLAAGLLLARLALAAPHAWIPPELAPHRGLSLDPGASAVAAGLALVVALVCGLAPGLRVGALAAAGSGASGPARPGRARRGLVVVQIALSVALVLGAGLLLRTVDALHATRPGFDPRGALTFRLSLRVPEAYRGPAQRAEFMRRVGAGVGDLPGVRAVGLVGVLPLEGRRWTQPYGLPGQPRTAWEANHADFRVATSGTFRALGTRILEGRGFTVREDVVESERVVVVDRILAERIAPGGSAVDAVIGIPLDGAPVEARVVGVVEAVRYDRLDADGREAIYVPYRQEASREVSFVVRTDADPAGLVPGVRRIVRELDPRIPVYDVRTLADYVDGAVASRTFALRLLSAFAGLALLCATIGLYGVVAFEVRRRKRDIGVRLAVGATRPEVVRTVLVSGLRMAGAGLFAGALLAVVVARALGSLVVAVDTADPTLWSGVVGLILVVTLAATWGPAVRASRLDPAEALRAE
ncbi:MAG TPA: FtsX-like permease family protein, partial [Longimicrobiales bacterium]|nr:FtsX-like permease family protein [Longimicrobiales bacterium]